MGTILCSDLHLLKKAGMWSGRAEISGDDLFALRQVIDICVEKDADLFLLGDVLDTAATMSRPLCALREEFDRLGDRQIRFIQGQHEMSVGSYDESAPWLTVFSKPEHMHGKVFDFHGKKAYALDYFAYVASQEALSSVPKDVQILFLHGTANTVMPLNQHFNAEDLPAMEYLFAGDYHHPVDEENLPNGGLLYYCGSAWMTAADEVGHMPRVLHVSSDTGFMVESIELKRRPTFLYTNLSDSQEELTQTYDDLPEDVRRPLVLVDIPLSPAELETLAEKAHLYITTSGKHQSLQAPDMPQEEVISDEAVLERCLDRSERPVEFAFILDIIQSPVCDAVARLEEKVCA